MSRHAVIRLLLTAKIDTGNEQEIVFRDVVQYTAVFALNSIPTASLLVAVGRNVQTGELATIHTALDKITTQLPVKIYLKAIYTSVEKADPGVPDSNNLTNQDSDADGFVIFDGRIVGTGWQRTENGAHFMIHLLHWLGDLNYASAISASSHPGNPASMTWPSISQAMGGVTRTPDSGDSGNISWVTAVSKDIINEGYEEDLWGNVIHKWLQAVTNDDPIDEALNQFLHIPRDANGDQIPDSSLNRQRVLAALARMGPNSDGEELALDLDGINGVVISDGIRQALVNETGGSWVNTTLWGKLVGEWAPAFQFSVVPRVNDVLIVPFTGGLNVVPWAVIGSEDYVQADLNAQMHQILRAVGIVHPVMFSSGINLGVTMLNTDTGGLAGYYVPTDVYSGMVLLKDAPKWLSDSLNSIAFSPGTAGIYGPDGAGRSTVNTGLDESAAQPGGVPAHDLDKNVTDKQNLLSRYARQWYVLESLKGRVGEVAGKLRFDIAPGSNVLVQAGQGRGLSPEEDIQTDIFATVTQVAYVINSESQRAGTAFSLAHIRSKEENAHASTSVSLPPLYRRPWPGAVLVKHPDIIPEREFVGG